MIQMQTSLEVADNSGARRVEMIMGIGGSTGACDSGVAATASSFFFLLNICYSYLLSHLYLLA